MNYKNYNLFSVLFITLALTSCADDDSSGQDHSPDGYSFQSRFDSQPSVSYSGQTFRQVLIEDLKAYMGSMDTVVDGTWSPADGEVVAALDTWFRFDSSIAGAEEVLYTPDSAASTLTYNDISAGKDLVGKLAGNDEATDHRDFKTEFRGWSDTSISAAGGSLESPEGLVIAFFETVEEQTIARTNGQQTLGPDGQLLPVYVTTAGLDLRQLTQKFLLGAVNFSQGTDDYLDDDVPGKGILSDNISAVEGKGYTALEHAWDEGFGYFGAHRHTDQLTLEEIAGKGGRAERQSGNWDADGDGRIDLKSEVSFGASVNAAKRDFGADAESPTRFSQDAFEAFVAGRTLISNTEGALDDKALAELRTYRDQIVAAWEGAYAATIVHYINETIEHMAAIGTPDYDFLAHATAWSELKGFALCFQFNPRSAVSDAEFDRLHTLLQDAPLHAGHEESERQAYTAALLDARELLGAAFGFTPANLEQW